jgi:hypothetical protein
MINSFPGVLRPASRIASIVVCYLKPHTSFPLFRHKAIRVAVERLPGTALANVSLKVKSMSRRNRAVWGICQQGQHRAKSTYEKLGHAPRRHCHRK